MSTDPAPERPLATLVTTRQSAIHELAFDVEVTSEHEHSRWYAVGAVLSGHLAAMESVVHPVGRRHVEGGRVLVKELLVGGRSAAMSVRGLEQHLRGDTYTGGHTGDWYAKELRERLVGLREPERQLVDELEGCLPLDERMRLAERFDAARKVGASRPHPHAPQSRALRAPAFWFNRRWDSMLDLMDNRSVPSASPRTPVPLGRWGAYLTGMPGTQAAPEDQPEPPVSSSS